MLCVSRLWLVRLFSRLGPGTDSRYNSSLIEAGGYRYDLQRLMARYNG
jgi:hypothetical protein